MKRYTLLTLLLACPALGSDGLLLTIDDPAPWPDPDTEFGNDFATLVALDGNHALVRSDVVMPVPFSTGEDLFGQVDLFDATTGERLQTFVDPLSGRADVNTPDYGSSIAIQGDHVLIGAGYLDRFGVAVGEAYLFNTVTGELLRTFEDPTPVSVFPSEPSFGRSVAIDGNRVVIGDPLNLGVFGQAHLFDITNGDLLQTFTATSQTPLGPFFGQTVAIDGDRVLVGSGGSGPFFDRDPGQADLFDAVTGELLHTFTDPSPTDRDGFGNSVALEGDYVVVGDPGDDNAGDGVGQAHLFDAVTGELLHTLDHPSPRNDFFLDGFGDSVAIDGDKILIGAPRDSRSGRFQGAAYLFDADDGSLLQVLENPTPRNPSGPNVRNFAASIAIDGGRLLIGDPQDSNGLNSGRAHLFAVIPEPTAATLLVTWGLPWLAHQRRVIRTSC